MILIDKDKCTSCGLCVTDCVSTNIELVNDKANVKRDTCLVCGHCIAICPENAISTNVYPMEDVREYSEKDFAIEPEVLLNFIMFRRSVRHFKKEQVEDDIILKIIEAGRFTATGSNRQKVSYIVVRENLAQLRRLFLEKISETTLQQAQQNPALASFAERWTNMLESDIVLPGKNDGIFYNAPAVILLVSDSTVDAALAASNMELMAIAQGLGVLYCGFFVRTALGNEKISDLLGISVEQEIKVCLVIGKPDVTYVRTVPRKTASVLWK